MKNLNIKSILFGVITFFVSSSIFYSCLPDNNENKLLPTSQLNFISYNENLNTEVSFESNQFNIKFKSKIDNGKVNSEVTIINSQNENNIHSDSFILDTSIKSYKLDIFNDIEEISTNLKNKFDESQWLEIQKNYEAFLKLLSQKSEIKKYQSDLIQSAFYHLSIYNTIIRSFNNKGDCECSPLPAYFIGKSSFWCQEDYFYDIETMLDHYNNNKKLLFSYEGGEKEYNYIIELKGKKKTVSHIDLFKLHNSVSDFKNFVNSRFEDSQNEGDHLKRGGCWFGQGSGLGCCGNYSGCCWYWHLNCLRHDVACLKCDKWHCGPACKSSLVEVENDDDGPIEDDRIPNKEI